eukprot:scaffold7204_cov354-Prasinococcus_capsulatus_cf.AAC.11
MQVEYPFRRAVGAAGRRGGLVARRPARGRRRAFPIGPPCELSANGKPLRSRQPMSELAQSAPFLPAPLEIQTGRGALPPTRPPAGRQFELGRAGRSAAALGTRARRPLAPCRAGRASVVERGRGATATARSLSFPLSLSLSLSLSLPLSLSLSLSACMPACGQAGRAFERPRARACSCGRAGVQTRARGGWRSPRRAACGCSRGRHGFWRCGGGWHRICPLRMRVLRTTTTTTTTAIIVIIIIIIIIIIAFVVVADGLGRSSSGSSMCSSGGGGGGGRRLSGRGVQERPAPRPRGPLLGGGRATATLEWPPGGGEVVRRPAWSAAAERRSSGLARLVAAAVLAKARARPVAVHGLSERCFLGVRAAHELLLRLAALVCCFTPCPLAPCARA